MSHAESFPPLVAAGARILILGSMPGQASLREQQYYAHPRNAFWPIMGQLFDAGPERSYRQRCDLLMNNGIAVWDVLRYCWRPGSLDSDIEPHSVEVNDFTDFLDRYPEIRQVFFNGRKAEQTFNRHVAGHLRPGAIRSGVLPSTSPAHAALSQQEKCNAWSVIASVR